MHTYVRTLLTKSLEYLLLYHLLLAGPSSLYLSQLFKTELTFNQILRISNSY